MTAEELQNAIQALKNSIELFSAQLEAVALGIPRNPAANAAAEPTIPVAQQAEALETANKRNGDVGPSDIKFIDALHKKFKPLFDELKPKTSTGIDKEGADIEDVLKGEEAEKVTKVSIVSISEGALESIKDALKPKNETPAGGGFLSGIMGFLGGAGATAAGGGLISLLTALPAALPGILVALGAIIGVAVALSAAVTVVVKTLSWLKDDIVGLFPVIDKFAEIFTDFAVAVIPVIGKALTEFTATVLPALIDAFTTFASVVIPAVIGAISDLISSPGFKFLAGALITLASQTIDVLGNLLTNTIALVKSVVTDIKDMLVSLFENAKAIIIPVVSDIKEMFIALIEPIERTLTNLFNNIREVLIPISNDVKETFIAIGEQVQKTVLGSLEKIDAIFSKIPDVFGGVFDKIAEFSNKVSIGKIGVVAAEIGALAFNLGALTASDLLGSLTSFFSDSPFEKIIDFQNKLDVNKFSILSTLAPALQKLMDVNVDQLQGVSSVLDELVDKSIEVSKTVEKIFSGSGLFKKSGGILELVDKLEGAKQGAENTITSVLVKTSDAQRKVSELQLNEAKMTNKILSDIFRKMDAMSMNAAPKTSAARPGTITVDESLPLQFTSTNTRQQILQSGNSK
jgi:hypothetical protein